MGVLVMHPQVDSTPAADHRGWRTYEGKLFHATRVLSVRRSYHLKDHGMRLRDRGLLTATEAANAYGVCRQTIMDWGRVRRQSGGQHFLIAGDEAIPIWHRLMPGAAGAGLVGGRLHLPKQVLEVCGPDLPILFFQKGQFAQMMDIALGRPLARYCHFSPFPLASLRTVRAPFSAYSSPVVHTDTLRCTGRPVWMA